MSAPEPLVVLNVVGLTPALLAKGAPRLSGLARDGFQAPLAPAFPALTCTAQADMLTGTPPSRHGIVGNGWYFRDLAEIGFWRQSNRLVRGDKVWHLARRRRPGFTCAQLFWWYNMYAEVEWSVTPRPFYPADGRKLAALYSQPADLQSSLEAELGPFPFFSFWGPKAGLPSSTWIANCARWVFARHRPTLTLVYLPHLDYDFQRFGPADPRAAAALAAIDQVAGALVEDLRGAGARVLVVSEYGIESVSAAVPLNRLLRNHGYLAVRSTPVGELLDPGASRAFAVVDHQVAQIYVRAPRDVAPVRALLASAAGVERVLGAPEQAAVDLDHDRTGELVVVAAPGYWFSYDYWEDPAAAPDFAPTMDIHRKPGYDPRELFLDPALRWPRLHLARRLLGSRLGLRTLFDVVPLDTALVRGSHGRPPAAPAQGAVVIGSRRDLARESFRARDIRDLILAHWLTPAELRESTAEARPGRQG